MKNKYKFLALLGFLPFLAQAQLTNNGAKIMIETGATLVVEGDINNNLAGEIQNSGTIQVKGNFTNAATADLTSAAGSIVEFIGDTEQLVTSNGDSFDAVKMSTVGGSNVKLVDDMSITGVLGFTADGLIDLDGNDLTFGSGASVDVTDVPGAGRFVKADGTGKVVRPYASTAGFTFPIGGSAYSPLTATADATDADAEVRVSVEETPTTSGGDRPFDAADYIDRDWDIETVNFGVANVTTLTGEYDSGDVTGTEANVKGAFYDVTPGVGVFEWSYEGSGRLETPSRVTGTITGDNQLQFTGMNTVRRQDIKVFLAAAYNGTDMDTDLNDVTTPGIIPPTSPYASGGSVSGAIKSIASGTVVDWVEVELRSQADGLGTNDTYSKLLLSNGDIANLDGSVPVTFRDAPATAFVLVNHRNHFGVMTSSIFTLGTPTLNFTTLADASTEGTNSQRTESGGIFSMWGGNANLDEFIRATEILDLVTFEIIPSDRDAVLNTGLSGVLNGQLNNYNQWDVNMDGITRATETLDLVTFEIIPSDRDYILNSALSGMLNNQITNQIPNN